LEKSSSLVIGEEEKKSKKKKKQTASAAVKKVSFRETPTDIVVHFEKEEEEHSEPEIEANGANIDGVVPQQTGGIELGRQVRNTSPLLLIDTIFTF
jgi:hypothetical protein